MEFLSDSWFDAMAAAVATVVVPDGLELAVGQVVTGRPGGDVAYVLDCRAGSCTLVRGGVERADVVFRSDEAVVHRVAAGTTGPPGHAVLSGDIVVTGDVTRLLAAGDLLARLSAAIATVE